MKSRIVVSHTSEQSQRTHIILYENMEVLEKTKVDIREKEELALSEFCHTSHS